MKIKCCRIAAALLLLGCSAAPALAVAQQAPGAPAAAATARVDGIELRLGRALMRVTALADDMIRVRIAPDGVLPEDASWAVLPGMRMGRVAVAPLADEGSVGFRTAQLVVRVDRRSLRLVVEDSAGRVVSSDAAPLSTEGAAFTIRKTLPQAEHFFGLGDKAGPLDRRGQAFANWTTDAYHYQESTDPLYKAVPFFVGVGGAGGSYGLLLDTSWRSWFDFGRRDPATLAFGAEDGPINYYLIHGPSTARVVQRYAELTGRPPLPPLWALGFQQSRWSYMSADEVRAIAARFRAERIPADVIWLDIDYQDRNRPFTVNRTTFPDLAGLAGDLRRDGFRLVAITDLHIAHAPGENYSPYDGGAAGGHFVRNADGSTYVGPVWPGPSVFPDFTRAATRAWWGGLYRDFMAAGISGFWNDMNEPAVFQTPTKTMPPVVVHRIEEPGFAPRDASHAEIHNIYGMQNSRATYEGMLRLAPDERPFVMTRASAAGGQRYAVTWTGDNSATWNHLKLAVAQLLNLGMSGFAYSGADVGGFVGSPEPDLLTRWIQIGAFTPIFRDHSAMGTAPQEPWVHGPEQVAIRRRFIEERYRLMPYIYALADENARTGAPLMRPVFYDYPQAIAAPCDQSMAFLLGARLLVAPPPDPESAAPYDVCLPAGRWYDYWTGAEPVTTPLPANPTEPNGPPQRVVRETPRLDRLPVFVRAGAIIPRQPLVQSTAETPQGPLTLAIYPGEDCHGTLYADDGHSLAYRRRAFLRQEISCSADAAGVTLSFGARSGSFHPWWTSMEVVVHGWRGGGRISVNDRALAGVADEDSQTLRFVLPDQRAPARVIIARLP